MKNKIKTSQLIGCQSTCYSVTVSPIESGFLVTYFLRDNKTPTGRTKKPKRVKVKEIIEDAFIPEISNASVKHLGYNTYKHLVVPGFYINLYYS